MFTDAFIYIKYIYILYKRRLYYDYLSKATYNRQFVVYYDLFTLVTR